jgi:uncharacterized protein (TIGR02722 family)
MNYLKLIPISLLVVGVTFTGCFTKKVKRIDPSEQTDLSGRWNDTDSRLVSNEMITDALQRPWRGNFAQENSKAPTVIIGEVVNNTHEIIPTETFIKDMEKAFINSGMVSVVQGGDFRKQMREEREDQQTNSSKETMKKFGMEKGADYILTGVMSSIVDKEGRNKIVFYQVDLELTDLETNEKVWIGDKKIKKAVKN